MEEKRVREEQEIEKRLPESGRDREEKQASVENEVQRAPKDSSPVNCSFCIFKKRFFL